MKTIEKNTLIHFYGGKYNKAFWHGFSCTIGIVATAASFYTLVFPPLAGTLVGIGFIGTSACAMTSPKFD